MQSPQKRNSWMNVVGVCNGEGGGAHEIPLLFVMATITSNVGIE